MFSTKLFHLAQFARSVTGSASSAAAVHTLDFLVLLELLFGNATDTGRAEVRLLRLDASGAAELGMLVNVLL